MKRKKLFALFVILTVVCLKSFAAAKAGEAKVDVDGTATISLASTYQNTLRNSTVSTYRWSTTSDNVKITSQSAYSCTIKGVSAGTAQVDYYCSYWIDGYYRTMDFYYTVTVSGGSQPLTISPSTMSLTYIGATSTVKATQNGTVGGVYFTSSDESVAKVGSGSSSGYTTSATVTAVGAGTTYIYAHNMKGETSTSACIVTVTVPKEYQTLALDALPVMTYGDGTRILPSSTLEGLSLTWSSDNSSVATISGRTLTVKGAGTATVKAYNSGNSSYYSFSRSYTLTVDKAALTITANDVSRDFGEVNPPLTVSYSGFVNGDDESVLTTKPTVTTTATVDSPAGTYPITASGAKAANYAMTYVDGTLTIKEATVYAVTAVAVGGGTVSVGTNELSLESTDSIVQGHDTMVKMIADEGYGLMNVTVNDQDRLSEVSDSILMLKDIQEDITVVATFQKLSFHITSNECTGGSIQLSATDVEWGDTVTVTVTPDDDYQLVSLTVNGTDVTTDVTDGRYVIYDVKCDIYLQASFIPSVTSISMGSECIRTYCTPQALSFSSVEGLKAYIATAFYPSSSQVLLTEVKEVPAGTTLILIGAEGDYQVSCASSSPWCVNMLKCIKENDNKDMAESEYSNYEFVTNNGNGQFVLAGQDDVPSVSNEGRVCLQLPLASCQGYSTLDIIVKTDNAEVMTGDVNGDGSVDVADIATIIGIMAAQTRR